MTGTNVKGARTRDYRCSFCGKSQDKVKRLIAGPQVYICNECVNLCQEIINQEETLADRLEKQEGDNTPQPRFKRWIRKKGK